MPTIIDRCPACSASLAGTVKPHCDGRTCGWVVCKGCGATVDPRRGTFNPGPARR